MYPSAMLRASRYSYPPLLLALTLVLAAAVRFRGLTAQSLWTDELASLHLALGGPLNEDFWSRVYGDVHPPGYPFFIWLWTSLLGDDEYTLRASSALFGVLGVGATHLLGRKLWGEQAGLCAALLATCSPLLIRYSQEVRAFSLNYLLAALLATSLVTLLSRPPDLQQHRRLIVATGACAALAAYVHYMGLIVSLGLFGLCFANACFRARAQLAKLVAAFAVAGLLYMPWIVSGLPADLRKGGLSWQRPPDVDDLASLPTELLPAFAYVGILLLSILNSPRQFKQSRSSASPAPPVTAGYPPAGLFCTLWLLGCVAFTYVKSIYGPPIYNPRNLLGAMPALFVALGAACSRMQPRGGLGSVAGTAVIGLGTLGYSLMHHALYDGHPKEPFREITAEARVLLDNAPETPVLSLSYSNGFYFDYYFRQLQSSHRVTAGSRELPELEALVAEQLERSARVIVLAGHLQVQADTLARWRNQYRIVSYQQRAPRTQLLLLERHRPARATGS